MKYQVLRELIDSFEAFEKETTQDSMKAFSEWLFEKMHPKNVEANRSQDFNAYRSLDDEIAAGIGVLSLHARHYVKTALKDSELVSIMDYLFLGTLLREGDMRKTELIAYNLAEFSPGMEVIRRLLRKNLIEDYSDPDDKRSKRVLLTPKGKKEFLVASESIVQASQVVTGNLEEDEKCYLVNLVRKLQAFHKPIWLDDNGTDLGVILKKYKD